MTHKHILEQVSYGAAGRRWTFAAPGVEYGTNVMPGGRVTADKIARVMNGAVKRTKGNGLDNLARSNMATIFHTAAQAKKKIIPHVGFTTDSFHGFQVGKPKLRGKLIRLIP